MLRSDQEAEIAAPAGPATATATAEAAPIAGEAPPPAGEVSVGTFDPRTLPIYDIYRRLRQIVVSLDRSADPEELVANLLQTVVETSSRSSGIIAGGRAYRRDDSDFELFAKAGEAGSVPIGYRVPASYEPIQEAIERGWALLRRTDPRVDPAIEAPIGADTYAIIVLGPARNHMLAFTLREPVPDKELAYALATLRSVADLALRQRELTDFIVQAREIQTSLLPREPPSIEGFDIAFRFRPAEIVGGDVFDFTRALPNVFGVCIADATGHGLPAALQSRDAIVGLRMGIEGSFKMVKTLEKLAHVIQAGSTRSRFISLFYTEIEQKGNLIYVNAGHPPPVIVRAGSDEITQLEAGGPVMGLAIPTHYEHSFERMAPGDALVLYTDGLPEATDSLGEELGLDRLVAAVRRARVRGAAAIAEAVFADLDAFTGGRPQTDDQTLVVVQRRAAP